ncbi:MAG: hypothetical protein KHX56_00075 [Clostridiales bacterium]|nr:hypothetical protein [Clostridiales bacterium]
MTKTLDERMAIVKDILFGQPGMLMTKPLKEGTLKNKCIEGCCTGYTFEVDNLSYRGIWVSTLEGIKIKVDGEEVPQEDIMVCLKGMKFPVCDLGGHTEVFWGARDKCVVNVNKVGGLSIGEHKIEIEILKRADFGHSYGEAEEGYENATEFHKPEVIIDEAVYTI